MRLQGKNALVTGAAVRVGRAIAVALARRGANIAIHCRSSRTEARQLSQELHRRFGIDSAVFSADLGSARQTRGLADAVLRRFETVSVLVNSASIYERRELGHIDAAHWDKDMAVNLRAPFLLSQALGVRMKRAGEGKIINIADWAGQRPYVEYTPYCVSKAGLLCLNTLLAKALAPQVQVNAVLPGPVLLPEGSTPGFRRAVEKATPLRRLGSPEDVANAVVFLIESSDFITGAALAVDGGRLIA